MGLIVSKPQGEYTPLPEGVYYATCYLVADIGEQYSKKYDKWSSQVIIGWQVDGETYERDGVAEPRAIHSFYKKSLHENSTLRKDLEAWRGKRFTAEELAGFDLRNIVGTGCQIQVTHWTKQDGRVADQVSAVMALPRGVKLNAPEKTIIFDLDTDLAKLKEMPNIVQGAVEKCRLFAGAKEEAIEEEKPFSPEMMMQSEMDEIDALLGGE